MVKVSHKVFKTVVKEILQDSPILGESSSEFSHLIPEPRNFDELTKFSDDIKKPWLMANMKEIENIINNQNFIAQEVEKDEPVNP